LPYQEIICSGQESNFDECNHFETSPCDSNDQAAGVVCFDQGSKLMDVSLTTEALITTDTSTIPETSTTTETPVTIETPVTTETTRSTETTTQQPTQETTSKPSRRGNKF
jgi:hypothetical protein